MIDTDDLKRVVETALAEDLRYGPDATTAATVPADAVATAALGSRAFGTLAGIPAALSVFEISTPNALPTPIRIVAAIAIPASVPIGLRAPSSC